MSTPLTAMPASFDAGTTVTLLLSYSDYPATTHAANLYLAGPDVPGPISGVGTGSAFAFTITEAISVALRPGAYSWYVRATKGSEVFPAASGLVVVNKNIATANAGDFQSWAAKTLPIVVAAIEGRLTADIENYSIGGRSVSKIPIKELLGIRASLASMVEQEADGNFVRNVQVTFESRGA